ncbi:MAG: tetratricopeptide repeat protein [Spirochaetes bacterium]|nr:tetratricopeptide repeat protein [Spirochaetota bacterium]
MNKKVKKLIDRFGLKKVIGAGILFFIILLFLVSPFRGFFKYYLYDSLHMDPGYFFAQGVKYEEKQYIHYSIGSFKRALKIKKGAFNIDPNNQFQMESLFNLGVVFYQHKKNYLRALFYFNKYITIYDQMGIKNPHEKEIYDVINFILSIDDSSKNAKAKELKNRGNKAYFQKDFQAALDLYKQALTMDPGFVEVYNNIATTYFQLKDFKNAVDYWKLTLLFTPEEIDIYINLALAYETQIKDLDQAVKYYEKVMQKLDPEDPRAKEAAHRIEILTKK